MARIAAVVLNQVVKDARVLREAQTLREAGHVVDIFGISANDRISFVHDDSDIRLVPHADHTRSFAALSLILALWPLLVLVALGGWLGWKSVVAYGWMVTLLGLLGLAALAIAFRGPVFRALALTRTFVGNVRLVLLYARRGYWDRSVKKPLLPEPATRAATVTAGVSDVIGSLLRKEERDWILHLHGIHRALFLAVRSGPYDVIHCHDFTALPVGIALKRERPEVQLVYDSHEFFSGVGSANSARGRWVRNREAAYAPLIDACITVNDSIADLLGKSYPKLPAPVVVCNATPCPPEVPHYDGRLHEAADIPADKKILLFQGGLAAGRGLEALTDSVLSLRPDWCIVYMAWGAYRTQLDSRLAALAAYDPEAVQRVRFIPGVSQAELPYWTAGAALGAILYEPTSINHVFCSPNKLWEYPRSGVPILCSDVPEMAKRVKAFGHGFLVPAEQLTGIGVARAVNGITDEALAKARRACRTFIEADNWTIYAQRLTETYARLDARRRGKPTA